MRNRRGYVLLAVMALVSLLGVLGILVASQIDTAIQRREADASRTQALWLARSAVLAGVTGSQTVVTAHGNANLRIERVAGKVVAVATLPSGSARVEAVLNGPTVEQWQERYDAARP